MHLRCARDIVEPISRASSKSYYDEYRWSLLNSRTFVKSSKYGIIREMHSGFRYTQGQTTDLSVRGICPGILRDRHLTYGFIREIYSGWGCTQVHSGTDTGLECKQSDVLKDRHLARVQTGNTRETHLNWAQVGRGRGLLRILLSRCSVMG